MFFHDLRYAVRSLLRNRPITFGIVLCLVTGIGATSAIFTVVNEAFLKPLPFKDAERLTILYDTQRAPDGELTEYLVAPANFAAWGRMNKVFDGLTASVVRDVNLTDQGDPERLAAAEVVPGFFSLLGVQPILGRTFQPGEDQLGGTAPVVVLSHGLWQRRFAGDEQIVGRSITLNDRGYTVIGVMPEGFGFPEGVEGHGPRDAWMPLAIDPHLGDYHFLFVFGRLRPDVSLERARGDMEVIAETLVRDFPEINNGFGVTVVALREALLGSDLRQGILRLSLGVFFLLAIACANVASMLLARATTRNGEVALRMALGCGRGRLLRLLLTESVLLACAGAAGSLLLTWFLAPRLIALSGVTVPAFKEITVDSTVFGFNLAVAVGVGVLFGLAPALKLFSTNVAASLLDASSRTGGSRWGRRLHAGLVVGEIGLGLVLLISAGLVMKSFRQLQQADPGFRTEQLLTLRLSLSPQTYADQPSRGAFVERVVAEVRTLPGVRAATCASVLPVGDLETASMFEVEGRSPEDDNEVLLTHHRVVGSGFFETMEIPIVEGRPFRDGDLLGDSEPVVIVSRNMAEQYWPGTSPVGRRIKQHGDGEPWFTVVGVAEDVSDSGLEGLTRSAWYRPNSQHNTQLYRLVVETATEKPLELAQQVRQTIWSLDPRATIYEVGTVAEMVSGSMAKERFSTVLLGLFAGIGLLLSAFGIYGLMSYSVNQRRAEVGIRMAMGADGRQVRSMILRQGMLLTAVGIALGVLLSFSVNRIFSSLLFDVGGVDPLTVAATVVLLALITLAATWLPARRAARVEASTSLKAL